jgi:hypothetical protein
MRKRQSRWWETVVWRVVDQITSQRMQCTSTVISFQHRPERSVDSQIEILRPSLAIELHARKADQRMEKKWDILSRKWKMNGRRWTKGKTQRKLNFTLAAKDVNEGERE